MERVGAEEQVSMTVDDLEIIRPEAESDEFSSSSERVDLFAWNNGMIRVDEGNTEHDAIKKMFLSGMGAIGKGTDVVSIHKNSHSTLTGQARFESFRIFSQAVGKKCGGDANINYAWYGASRGEIYDIISHGFSRLQRPKAGELYGFGVYLSSAKFSIDCALSSAEDENGLRHVMLCRVILGNMETVHAGSQQFHPCSKEYDSGVDDVSAPRRYIIWSAYMNSHILPSYIISFRAPLKGVPRRIQANLVKPTSPWMKFHTLLSVLSKVLPPHKMTQISKYHCDFHRKKITRQQLVKRLRQIAGDEMLTRVIKLYRTKDQTSCVLVP